MLRGSGAYARMTATTPNSNAPRTPRRILWIASLFLVPVPLWIFAMALVPTARLVELAIIVLITIAVEGPGGVGPLILALFLGHAALYAILLWMATWLLCMIVDKIYRPALGPLCALLILGAVLWSLSLPVYTTPFHANLPHSTLWEVYQ